MSLLLLVCKYTAQITDPTVWSSQVRALRASTRIYASATPPPPVCASKKSSPTLEQLLSYEFVRVHLSCRRPCSREERSRPRANESWPTVGRRGSIHLSPEILRSWCKSSNSAARCARGEGKTVLNIFHILPNFFLPRQAAFVAPVVPAAAVSAGGGSYAGVLGGAG